MAEAPLRIGLVGPLPPPAGGMANQTLQLAGLLRAEGYLVDLVQVNPPYRPAWIARLRGLRAVFRLLPYLVRLWRVAGRADLLHVMANSGWSWHLFAAPAVWIGWLRRCPVVLNYRGGEADTFMARSAPWVRPSLRRAQALIVPSGFLQAVFGKYGVASTVVPNIVDLAHFAARATSRTGRDAPCLLVARNLEAIYDNATALRAFALVRARYPAATLVLAGSGPEREPLVHLAAELGIAAAVQFTGRIDRDAMAALLRGADVMLNPSTVDNMPNSVLEALASGVAVVSTDVGGVPYLVEHGCSALLVPARAPQAMAQAALRLLDGPELATRLRYNGLQLVQQFAWTAVRPRLMETYRSVMRAH